MKHKFNGWEEVADRLKKYAGNQQKLYSEKGEKACRINEGQRASLLAIAERITNNGVVIADEVGMGKTRIAVELARSVIESGGRVVILVPPGLGYQWQAELRDGKVEAPLILRSLWQYLAVWEKEMEQHPWFRKQVVVISHAFTNWRLSESSDHWRWALLPELYARWRKRIEGRFPRGYCDNKELNDSWVCNRVCNAAKSICDATPEDEQHPAWHLADELSRQTPWPGALQGGEYGRNNDLRPWLERAVGLGLGIFDLVIIDEAHKSRATDSGLSRLIDHVVLPATSVRKLAMTATPVELDVSQWQETLDRIGLKKDELSLTPIPQAITGYAEAVKRIRQCPSSKEALNVYKQSAIAFQGALSPYLLRRNKSEDPAVQLFLRHSHLPTNAYRRETEIAIETATLPTSWRQAVCAAESLSLVTHQSDDLVAKRLRLTLCNGHGISALLGQDKFDEKLDMEKEEYDKAQSNETSDGNADSDIDNKRQERAEWWLKVMTNAFSTGDDSLFDHPAILAAAKSIEEVTGQGEKVLVFGRFTRPLHALVDLLNAREMLRCLESKRLWPQAKVHGSSSDGADQGEWPAVRAAHRQLQCRISLEQIDQKLKTQYTELEKQREKLRSNLIDNIENGLRDPDTAPRTRSLFAAFKMSAQRLAGIAGEGHPLALISKALHELMEDQGVLSRPDHFAEAFTDLLNALTDRGEGDSDDDRELDEQEANQLWPVLEERLHEEYNRPQGSFARIMFGETKPASRRMIQLAFNRMKSYPKVLVAQSLVGREGLNLHKACRTVILLHPEWNPGVVEQQIGRVDRVGSHWATLLTTAIQEKRPASALPRIEVCPVIFKGTYDEHNWKVLRQRWDDLRAQLHGIIIPPRLTNVDHDSQMLIDEIAKAAPNFSPSGLYSAP